ncbi:MAG: AAA domain-containing protein [Candidatus Cyclobacteriaceae bacterium M3_2C_046]
MHKILQSYLRRLTNLSSNNRSLLLLRLSEQFIDVHQFDFLLNQPSFSVIQQLIDARNSIKVCRLLDSRDNQNNEVSHKLKKIQRTDQFIFEERGSKDLYIGWPFIRGKFYDDTPVRCPLIFFPVSLQLYNDEWAIKIRQEVNVTFNKSFLLAFSYFNQVPLDEQLIEHVFDDFDKDSRVFRTSLYQLLKESPLELNFNQENFLDKLIAFENYNKAQFEKNYKTGELKLFPEAVLGIFPQAGSQLVPDYLNLIQNNKIEDIEAFFLHRTQEDDKVQSSHSKYFFFLNKIKEEQTFTPFELDAYQENALKAIKKGNSLVIQGPPGTGKSQLICNLIADFIARGKNVLLVCQKRVALDVVYNRLKEKKLHDFIGLVHDFKNDRKYIYEQIANQIDNLYDYKTKNNSLDAIQLERQFQQASRRIDQVAEELEEFKAALFDESECNLSVKELYLTSDFYQPSINLKQEYKHFPFEQVNQFIPRLKTYAAYAAKFNKEEYPWKTRVRFKNYSISDQKIIREIIEEVPRFQDQLSAEAKKILQADLSLEAFEAILSWEEKIKELLRHLRQEKVYDYFRFMISFKDKETDYLWIGTMERVVMECFRGAGPEVTLSTADLGQVQEAIQKRIESRKGLIDFMKWQLFAKEKKYLKKILSANDLQDNKRDFQVLVEKVDNRLNLEHNITKLKNYKTLKDVPVDYDQGTFEAWFTHQKKAVLAKLIFSSLRNFKEYFNVYKLSYEELRIRLENLLGILRIIPETKRRWQAYLTPSQIHQILNDPVFGQKLLQTLEQDFEGICDFDNLNDSLSQPEQDVINKLLDETSDYSEHNILNLFQNSIRLAWIEHIETKYPILRSVSSLKFEKLQQEFQENVKLKQQVSNEIVLLKARERTYHDLEFNRLNNMVTYRDLNHQVTKKKKIWPVRKLINQFNHELFDLIPCWMASPEAVSAIFPMEQMFDLVIFDEASQCFVEKGIPAMYRGKQVVVTGDDQQLSPYDLYQVRWEEEQEEDPALEVDSLLNLTQQYLMQVQLRGHYRSKSLDLIEFSNQHFYHGALTTLPERLTFNQKEPSIAYIKVDGCWESNQNQVEAEKIVALTLQLIQDQPKKEIGIVTFNIKQQYLIMDLLDEAVAQHKTTIPDSLIIKNIENIQGDEKDILLFSIGYAPDQKGKMMMQFGSLNQEKGENRLNVAVTRAREKVIIVSSIFPHQLKVDNTKNEGPKLLKAYLNYALNVSEGKFKPSLPAQENHQVNWYLKKKLVALIRDIETEFEFKEDLPFADLSIEKQNAYAGLILTDDNLYHESVSAKEAHVYKTFNFNQKNWPFRDFYSREFWHDKEVVKERIIRFLKNVL